MKTIITGNYVIEHEGDYAVYVRGTDDEMSRHTTLAAAKAAAKRYNDGDKRRGLKLVEPNPVDVEVRNILLAGFERDAKQDRKG